jgi:hypothetical protein
MEITMRILRLESFSFSFRSSGLAVLLVLFCESDVAWIDGGRLPGLNGLRSLQKQR